MSGGHIVSYRRGSRALPGTNVRQHFQVVHPIASDDGLIAVVGGHGEPRMFVVPRDAALRGFPQVWGCAICEQFHPIEVKGCPLVGYPAKDVTLGPYVVDGQALYFALKVPVIAPPPIKWPQRPGGGEG
jgi:hypothetical protein